MESKTISQSKHEKYNKIENFIPILIKDKEHSIKIGSFGEMILCKNKFNSKYFLIKSIKPNEINEEIVKNINLLYKQSLLMRNKHILKVISIINTSTLTSNEIHIVYEYFKGVSLSEKLMTDESGFFSYTNKMEVLLLFSKIVSSVSYIHQKGQVHGSINIENILIDDTLNFKLIGLNNFEDVILNSDPNQNILIDYLTDERLSNKKITVATDFFNLGELLYEMFHGYSPFYPNINIATISLTEMIEKNISPDEDRVEEIDEELIIENILQKRYTFNEESKNHPDVISLISYMIDNNQTIGSIDNIYKLEIIQDINTYKLRKRYEKHKKQYDIDEFTSIEGVNFVSDISENNDESQSDNDLYNNIDDEYDELNYNRNQLNNATKVDATKYYRLYSYYSNYDTKVNRNSKNNSICLDMITDFHNQNHNPIRLSKIERDTVGSNLIGKQGRTGLLLSKIKESYSTNKSSFGERKLTTRSIIRKEKEKEKDKDKEKENNKEIDFNMTIEEKFEEEKLGTSKKLVAGNSNKEIKNVS